ncbi:MAG: class I SAM-dependent methyltransferase [Nostocoides sp.]
MSGPGERREQRGYSELMDTMLDEHSRRAKAAKIIAVLGHALGRSGDSPLAGLDALDVGCSAGFIADSLAAAGAATIGVDIDQPGLAKARDRFGDRVDFRFGRGEALPLADGSVDIAVFNHIYEHVVDPEAVVADVYRVLRPGGVLYAGLGHKWQVLEPHYKLPFLSWLPRPAADRYMKLTGRGDSYYERYYTPRGLRRLLAAYDLWDYTLPVLAQAEAFAGDDVVPGIVGHLPLPVLTALRPAAPTYVWVGFKGPAAPSGPPLRVSPQHLR